METVGAKLKKIRQEKGLSIEEVQKKTKIHPNILKAIEEDNFINLSPVYVKGFLKIYCKYLGIDPSQFIVEYSELERTSVDQAAGQGKSRVFSRSASVKLASDKSSRLWNTVIKIILLMVLVFLAAAAGIFTYRKAADFIKSKTTVSGKDILKKAEKTARVAEKPVKKPPKTPVSPAKHAAVVTQKVKTGIPIRLGIRAKEDCWVKLSMDGKVVFQSILKKGRSESWQAKREIGLSLGNAGGVELEVNGTLIPAVGRKGQSVKNIVINEEGLKVN